MAVSKSINKIILPDDFFCVIRANVVDETSDIRNPDIQPLQIEFSAFAASDDGFSARLHRVVKVGEIVHAPITQHDIYKRLAILDSNILADNFRELFATISEDCAVEPKK
jgi:hypothetical protein